MLKIVSFFNAFPFLSDRHTFRDTGESGDREGLTGRKDPKVELNPKPTAAGTQPGEVPEMLKHPVPVTEFHPSTF